MHKFSKEDQNIYLASLKEYRDWYAVLNTAENKGIQKGLEEAKEKIEKAQIEKEKAQIEKEKALKREEKALEDKENTLKKIEKSILKLYKKGFSIEDLSEDFDLSINDIKKIIDENK